MEEYSGYVGLDVHKDTIVVAVAYPGRSKPESLGVIANTKKSILNLVHRPSPDGEAVGFCYEAGPCGYEVYRLIKETFLAERTFEFFDILTNREDFRLNRLSFAAGFRF